MINSLSVNMSILSELLALVCTVYVVTFMVRKMMMLFKRS